MEGLDLDLVFLYMSEIVIGLLIVGSPLLVALVFYLLGKKDIFFTLVEEGQAKAILNNGKFHKMVMSYTGHRFRGKIDPTNPPTDELYDPQDPEASEWDIVAGEARFSRFARSIPVLGGLLGGLRWIGIPPFSKLHTYRFEWITLEHQRTTENGKEVITSSEVVPTPHKEDNTSIILVQLFTYFAQLKSAETRASSVKRGKPELGIPVDVDLLLNTIITNPFKALFRMKHWLQIVTNQTMAFVRLFIGSKEIEQLIDTRAASDELKTNLEPMIADFIRKFGVKLDPVQIQSVQIAGDYRKDYQKLTTIVYEAGKRAKARSAEADAEKNYLQKTVGYVASLPGGTEAFKWLQLANPNIKLLTYVEGGAGQVGVNVPTNNPTTGPATKVPAASP